MVSNGINVDTILTYFDPDDTEPFLELLVCELLLVIPDVKKIKCYGCVNNRSSKHDVCLLSDRDAFDLIFPTLWNSVDPFIEETEELVIASHEFLIDMYDLLKSVKKVEQAILLEIYTRLLFKLYRNHK